MGGARLSQSERQGADRRQTQLTRMGHPSSPGDFAIAVHAYAILMCLTLSLVRS